MTTSGIDRSEITGSVVEIVAEVLGVEPASLGTDTDLRAVEGADSIKVLRIIAKIEQRYDIELEDEDVFGVSTVDQVADVVARRCGNARHDAPPRRTPPTSTTTSTRRSSRSSSTRCASTAPGCT